MEQDKRKTIGAIIGLIGIVIMSIASILQKFILPNDIKLEFVILIIGICLFIFGTILFYYKNKTNKPIHSPSLKAGVSLGES